MFERGGGNQDIGHPQIERLWGAGCRDLPAKKSYWRTAALHTNGSPGVTAALQRLLFLMEWGFGKVSGTFGRILPSILGSRSVKGIVVRASGVTSIGKSGCNCLSLLYRSWVKLEGDDAL